MSRKASPTLIGAFVMGGIVLTVVGVAYLSSVRFFSQDATFVLYFSESVNGLSVGAPVKFKGVPIGHVHDIYLRWNQRPGSDDVAVFVSIDMSRLRDRLGVQSDWNDIRELRTEIRNGLRARLQVESLITNLLFVEINYFPDTEQPPRLMQLDHVYPEIPTIPSALAALGQSASDVLTKLTAIDLGGIGENLKVLLTTLNREVDGLELARLTASITRTSDEIGNLLESGRIAGAAEDVAAAARSFQALVLHLEEQVTVLSDSVNATLAEAQRLVQDGRSTVQSIDHVLSPNSPVMYELQHALRELARFADAARALAEMLERNPRALLTGKATE